MNTYYCVVCERKIKNAFKTEYFTPFYPISLYQSVDCTFFNIIPIIFATLKPSKQDNWQLKK